jgi:aminopeptidase N
LRAGRRYEVVVRYAGRPAEAVSEGESNWLASSSEVVTMNEPHMAAWWFPANDHPRDKATFDIHITVPPGTDVVANGVEVGSRRAPGGTTTHWHAAEPMAPYLAFFAAGSFDILRTRCHGIDNVVAVSKLRPAGPAAVDVGDLTKTTCDVITAYSKVLGPYPFRAVGGLVTGLSVAFALENQTRPTYPSYAGPSESLVAHELAHQWFGDSVSVSDWSDIWLNEGFAQYLQTYYVTEVTQGKSMQAWLGDSYDRLAGNASFWRLAVDDPGPQHLFDDPIYVRGAMALQALRHRVGDAAFWSMLRSWASQRAGGNGSVAEFEALAGSISGQDLSGFFDTWLHAGTAPARTAQNGF